MVNIMADCNLGGSTVKDEWKKALAKGLIPKTERMSLSKEKQATIMRGQGKSVKRISGEPYVDSTPQNVTISESKSTAVRKNLEKPQESEGSGENPDLSGISKQISTSMESVKKDLRSGLEQFEARPKKVERA